MPLQAIGSTALLPCAGSTPSRFLALLFLEIYCLVYRQVF